jgi:3-oxoacyl-[acyl-carrier protein] reductase
VNSFDPPPQPLAGRVALVTGGGTGIGRATTLSLAGAGAAVAINYSRSRSDAEQTAAEVTDLGGRAIVLAADVRDDSAVRALVAEVVAELGQLDILINNAGITRAVTPTDLDGITDADFESILGTNVRGLFYCCRAAIAVMREAGRGGHIVNLASIAGISGSGSSLIYSASKGAVITLTRGLAASQAPEIQINAVAPGVVDTRWLEAIDPATLERISGATPMQRSARPEDVAHVILSLVTSEYMTGEVVTLAGGRTA